MTKHEDVDVMLLDMGHALGFRDGEDYLDGAYRVGAEIRERDRQLALADDLVAKLDSAASFAAVVQAIRAYRKARRGADCTCGPAMQAVGEHAVGCPRKTAEP